MHGQKPLDPPAPTPATEAWPQPVPFDVIETPDFPTESLPGVIGAFVEALAESTQTPEEMGAILVLAVLATIFQRRFVVEVTPDWKEQLSLFVLAVAFPGERKTAVIGTLNAPLYAYERLRQDMERVEIAQNRTRRAFIEKALAAAQNQGHEADALVLSAELAEFKDKHKFRLLADDTTPEKLTALMETQEGAITVASAEGGVFDSLRGRYDNSSFDVYLKGHAGDPITVDRIGRESNTVLNPRLTMMLTVQPEVLNGLMSNDRFKGRGLCGRFLYAICKSKMGSRNVNPQPIPEAVKAEYHTLVQRLLDRQDAGIIRLSPEANALRLEYAACIERRLGDEWAHMADWGGKMVGAMLRIAGLIHATEAHENPADVAIGPEVVTAAIKIAEFLGAHAEAAYQAMGTSEAFENAKYLLRRIENTGRDEISKRDLFDICKGKFRTVDAMEPALNMLIDMGYARIVEINTGGRPSKKLLVNPLSKSSKSRKSRKSLYSNAKT